MKNVIDKQIRLRYHWHKGLPSASYNDDNGDLMHNRRDSLRALGALAGALIAPAGALASAPPALKDIAARKGLRFGNAMGMGGKAPSPFDQPGYRALMARECAVLVAENETKWPALQPKAGPHQFAQADRMFAWACENSMQLRGHTLVWQSPKWLPGWVNKLDFGSLDAGKQRAEQVLRDHIKAVCGHFGNSIYSYDVVNEAIAPADGRIIQNVFSERLGGIEQIDLAFRLAHEHAPGAQLVYNDYMGPGAGSAKHRAGVLKLLADLRKRGTPVHALGLQSHIGQWEDQPAAHKARDTAEWRKFLDEATAMDLDLLITEFDVNDSKLPANIAERDALAAALARDYLDVTLSYPRCRDFLLWGMADHVSWLQTWKEARRKDGLPSRPTPFDSNYAAKPMRAAIAAAMETMPPRAQAKAAQG